MRVMTGALSVGSSITAAAVTAAIPAGDGIRAGGLTGAIGPSAVAVMGTGAWRKVRTTIGIGAAAMGCRQETAPIASAEILGPLEGQRDDDKSGEGNEESPEEAHAFSSIRS